MSKRGMLNETVQEISLKFLGREITTIELRLLPYIDYCIKNGGRFNSAVVSENEMDILNNLQLNNYICLEYGNSHIKITREFYKYIQEVLAESYVDSWLETSCKT